MTAGTMGAAPDRLLDSLVEALHERFGTAVEVSAIIASVEAARDAFRDARVTDFVPILVARRARANLGVIARAGAAEHG